MADTMISDILRRKKAKETPPAPGEEGEGEDAPDETYSDTEDDGPSDAGGVESDAADELASIVGVPEADKGRFATALKQYVAACIAAEDEDDSAAVRDEE